VKLQLTLSEIRKIRISKTKTTSFYKYLLLFREGV